MYDEQGRARSVLTNPLDPATPVDAWDRAADVGMAASPLLDAVIPGAGVAVTGILAGLGYGTRRGRQTTEEKYQTADEWYRDGVKDRQVSEASSTGNEP